MRRYFSWMYKEKGSGRALEPDQFFRDRLCFFLFLFFIFFIFYLFLLVFYFRILFLYITDFNPKINKDIIIIILWSGKRKNAVEAKILN